MSKCYATDYKAAHYSMTRSERRNALAVLFLKEYNDCGLFGLCHFLPECNREESAISGALEDLARRARAICPPVSDGPDAEGQGEHSRTLSEVPRGPHGAVPSRGLFDSLDNYYEYIHHLYCGVMSMKSPQIMLAHVPIRPNVRTVTVWTPSHWPEVCLEQLELKSKSGEHDLRWETTESGDSDDGSDVEGSEVSDDWDQGSHNELGERDDSQEVEAH